MRVSRIVDLKAMSTRTRQQFASRGQTMRPSKERGRTPGERKD